MLSENFYKDYVRWSPKISKRGYIGILETTGGPNLPINGITFFDDNCPIHRARNLKNWKPENSLHQYSLPAHFSDLNTIKNVRAYVKRPLQCMVLDHENMEKAVVLIWNKIPTEFLLNLYRPLPNRVHQWLNNQGIPIQYWNKLNRFVFPNFHRRYGLKTYWSKCDFCPHSVYL